jgi:ribosome-associated toxin RatA of RatAB toxin-antitoxin module
MFIGKQSILIKRKLDLVYALAGTYPKFVSFFSKKSKIIYSNDQRSKVAVRTKLWKFIPTRWLGSGKKVKNFAIYFRQDEGLFKNLKAHWVFREEKGQTRVTIKTVFRKKAVGKGGEFLLGKLMVERTTKKILKELKRVAESMEA